MTERAEQPVKRPRRMGPCAVEVADVLASYQIAGARFFKRKHGRVEFEVGGHTLTLHFACTPRSDSGARKRVRAQLTKLIEGALNAA